VATSLPPEEAIFLAGEELLVRLLSLAPTPPGSLTEDPPTGHIPQTDGSASYPPPRASRPDAALEKDRLEETSAGLGKLAARLLVSLVFGNSAEAHVVFGTGSDGAGLQGLPRIKRWESS
jgi:hypothetical protein